MEQINYGTIMENLVACEDYATAESRIQDDLNILREYLFSSKLEDLEEEIERKKASLSRLAKREQFGKNIHFLVGRYIGYLNALDDYTSVAVRKKAFRDSINSYSISEIPHVNDIILTVMRNEGIRHGKLAECVGIEKSTLTGIMDRLVEKGAISFSRPGKYKYYYLTEIGRQYYEENRAIIDAETDIDALTEQLLLALSKEEDINQKMVMVIRKIFEGKNAFEGYKSREHIEPALVFAGIPTIKPINVMTSNSQPIEIDHALTMLVDQEDPVVYLLEKKHSVSNNLYENVGAQLSQVI